MSEGKLRVGSNKLKFIAGLMTQVDAVILPADCHIKPPNVVYVGTTPAAGTAFCSHQYCLCFNRTFWSGSRTINDGQWSEATLYESNPGKPRLAENFR